MSAMILFNGVIAIGVSDLDATIAWYKEKFELRESGHKVQDGDPGDTELVSRNGEIMIVLSTGIEPQGNEPPPILNTADAAKAREWLLAHGVNVGPVQTDIQGTRYIEMRDLDKNMIEISEEP